MLEKNCICCKNIKLLNQFSKNNRAISGFSNLCKECANIRQKIQNKKHKAKISLNKQLYYKKNKKQIIQKICERTKKRKTYDSFFKLKLNLRRRVLSAINRKRLNKDKKIKLIDCSWNFFKIYIETQFRDGMTWDNYGKIWHLDHIKPISLANNIDELMLLNNYKNLQPLLSEENLKKGNKYV